MRRVCCREKPEQGERAPGGPTYEAGLPACIQGAVGRVLAGLRKAGRVIRVIHEALYKYEWLMGEQKENVEADVKRIILLLYNRHPVYHLASH